MLCRSARKCADQITLGSVKLSNAFPQPEQRQKCHFVAKKVRGAFFKNTVLLKKKVGRRSRQVFT